MKRVNKPAVSAAGLVIAALFYLCMLSVPTAGNPQVNSALPSLAYFTGDWECSGKFDASGKSIEAHQHFEPELEGTWISFRHDDKPPFNYHALAEWGWEANRKDLVMIVQDSTGGVRVFHSSGWNATQLVWDGSVLDSSSIPSQRFIFERLDDRHFKVSYFTLKGADWSRMDSSTCSKQ